MALALTDKGESMRTPKVALLAALATTLSLAAGGASAARLSINESQFRLVFNPMSIFDGSTLTRCPVTLQGSFHTNTFAKVANNLIGVIASGSTATCPNGVTMTLLTATLPWHVRYEAFEGVLPAISRVRIRLVGIAFALSNTLCLFGTTESRPGHASLPLRSGGAIVNLLIDETFPIVCGAFAGEAAMTRPRDGGAISISLA